MGRGQRVRIAPCTYEDASGIDTIVKYRGQTARERWSKAADRDELKRWVQRTKSELMDRDALEPSARRALPPSKETLVASVARFLKQRKGRVGTPADASHLKAWTTALGETTVRRKIAAEALNHAIADWREAGVSDKTIIHRCRALRDLYRVLDGKHHRCHVADADVPKTPHPHPVAPTAAVCRKVAAYLAKHAPAKHLARFQVLWLCAQRPCQVERAQPEDVDLKRRRWIVRSAKGEPSHTVHLNREQVQAWRLFIKTGCWGQKAHKQYRGWLRKAGYPATLSPYNVRHQTAQAALDRGADLGDVQGLLGHTEIETTRRMYAPLLVSRQKRVARLLDGRAGDTRE